MELRALIDHLPAIAWTSRPEGHLDFCNRRFCEYTGSTFEELEGRGWTTVIAPAALPAVLDLRERSLRTAEPFEMAIPIRGADGVFRTFLTRVCPLRDEGGGIICWIGIGTGVEVPRELRDELEAERWQLASAMAELEALFDNSLIGLAFIDRDLRYRRMNRMLAEDVHGIPAADHIGLGSAVHEVTSQRQQAARDAAFKKATSLLLWTADARGSVEEDSTTWREFTGQTYDEWRGFGWLDTVHPDDRARAEAAWTRAVHDKCLYEVEYRVCRRDGAYVWTAAHGTPVLDDAGDVIEWVGANTDISARKALDERLENEHARYAALIEAVGDIVWTNSPHGEMRGPQPMWCAYTGQSEDQAQGYGWSKAVHPSDAQPTIDAWRRAVATRSKFVFEHRVRRYDGVYRWFAVRAVPVLDATGSIREWVGLHRDIHEEKQASEALDRERKLLELFIDRAPAQLAMFDREMRYLAVSRRWLADYGLTTDIVGESHYDVFPNLPERWREVQRRTLAGEVLSAEEDPLVRADGRTQWTRWETRPWYEVDGSIGGMIIAGEDVTSRVESRRALEKARAEAEQARAFLTSIQQVAQIGIFEWDGRSSEVYWSPELYALLGRRPGEIEATVESWNACLHPDDRELGWESFRRALATQTSTYELEERVSLPDGSWRWLRTTNHLTFDDAGQMVRCVGSAVDIQELRELAERERAARLIAEEASHAKDDFLAMLGHELRNPLAPIATAVQLLKLRSKEGISRELSVIERQSQHIARLVDDLLDVSRIAQGKVTLQRAHVEVAELVAAAIETASPVIERGRHSLRTNVPTHGLIVDADPARMVQVLANMLTNAAKYTPADGEILISAAREGAEVVLTVQDTGVGISPELLPHVFDMFVQARQTLDRAQGGLGLGLALVKNLVSMHGGTVAAQSSGPGQGSTFIIRLPAVVGTSHAEASRAPPVSPARETLRLRILIVDDNEDAAEMLAVAMDNLGYQTAVAHDAPQALRVADDFAPHLALLDIGLPVMDGYELAIRLRARWRDVKLVALTGYGQESDRDRARAVGFQGHLTKPVHLEKLSKLIAGLATEMDGTASRMN